MRQRVPPSGHTLVRLRSPIRSQSVRRERSAPETTCRTRPRASGAPPTGRGRSSTSARTVRPRRARWRIWQSRWALFEGGCCSRLELYNNVLLHPFSRPRTISLLTTPPGRVARLQACARVWCPGCWRMCALRARPGVCVKSVSLGTQCRCASCDELSLQGRCPSRARSR